MLAKSETDQIGFSDGVVHIQKWMNETTTVSLSDITAIAFSPAKYLEPGHIRLIYPGSSQVLTGKDTVRFNESNSEGFYQIYRAIHVERFGLEPDINEHDPLILLKLGCVAVVLLIAILMILSFAFS